MRLLLLENEQHLADKIAAALREEGFAVTHAVDGLMGADLAQKDTFDLIITDLVLPGRSGRTVLCDLRESNRHTPVLILAAHKTKESVVELLNNGADDYLEKPFDLEELIARVRVLIRRSNSISIPALQFLDFEMDTVRQIVKRGGQKVSLSPTEYSILEYLALRPGAIVSKRELLDLLHSFDRKHPLNIIEVHVSNLRKKLNLSAERELIETVRKHGYKFNKRVSS